MAQQIINYGNTANDGTGDPLRDAFIKVDNNFDQIWAAGPVGSNITIQNNTIAATDTNGNIILSPNGVGIIQTNRPLYPRLDNTYDLGSSNLRYRSLFTGAGGISTTGDVTLGNIANLRIPGGTNGYVIQTDGTGNLSWTAQTGSGNGNPGGADTQVQYNNGGLFGGSAAFVFDDIANALTVAGNISGNYILGNGSALTGIQPGGVIQGNVPPPSPTDTTLWWDDVTGRLYVWYNDGSGSQWVDAAPAGPTPTYGNSNVSTFLASGQVGNIVPSGNAVYSLGNATSQWADLYVANNTIYMNNVPISLTAGNVLTVNGQDVVTSSNGFSELANLYINGTTFSIIEGASEEGINISPNGESWAYLYVPTDYAANIYDTRLHNDAGNIEFGTGDFSTGITSYTWTLDNTGNLNLPTNGDINFAAGGIVQTPDEDFRIRVQDADDDGFAVQQQVDDGAGNVLGSTELQRDRFVVQFAGGTVPQFRFTDTGQTEIPGNIRATEYVDTSLYSVSDNVNNGSVELKVISYSGDVLGSNVRVTQSNATISTNNALYTWNFDNAGNLNLPLGGNLVGTTPNNNGYLSWFGNSSGDGAGYTTLRLIPDDTRESSDQYLIIDPTAPGHIHIRAGGTQDASSADLFIGGENSYFKVAAGANADVAVRSNGNTWTFDTLGVLTLPGEGTLRSIGDTVNLQSYNVGTGNVNSVYLGSGGGLGFFDQDIGGNWLEIFRSGAEPEIRVPVGRGNLNIQTAEGITPYNWTFDNTGNLTAPGNITASTFVTTPVPLANLTAVAGARAFVSDGNLVAAGNFGAQIGNAGSNIVPVWSNGSNWYIG